MLYPTQHCGYPAFPPINELSARAVFKEYGYQNDERRLIHLVSSPGPDAILHFQ